MTSDQEQPLGDLRATIAALVPLMDSGAKVYGMMFHLRHIARQAQGIIDVYDSGLDAMMKALGAPVEAAEEPAIAFMAAAAALRVTTPRAQLLSASQFASATSPREYRLGPASPAVQ